MSVTLSVDSRGERGPVVVVLHGLLGSSTNWRGVARTLAEHARVFCLDARNHGASPHAPGMSYADMADDVRAFMDASGLERAALVGHSMGGKTAMRLALESPERVERLVVVDIAPVSSPSDHLPLLDAMARLDPAAIGSRGEADRALEPAVPDAGVRQFVLQNLVRDSRGFAWRIDLPAIRAALPDILDFPAPPAGTHYAGPTLFLRGERSSYVLAEHDTAIRTLFPTARIVGVPGAGHWVHAEQPARFLELLGEFLHAPPGAPAPLQ